jgi:hypothetical protein
MPEEMTQHIRQALCPSCRLNPEVEDLLRRAHLREVTYEEILRNSHEDPVVDSHELDLTRNFVVEHLGSDRQDQEELPRGTTFRLISHRTHPELGDHDLRIMVTPYGTMVVSILHPRRELDRLIERGNYLSREAWEARGEHR